jgi:hypothetical protein
VLQELAAAGTATKVTAGLLAPAGEAGEADPSLLPMLRSQPQQQEEASTAAAAHPASQAQPCSSSIPSSGQQFQAALSALQVQPQQSEALLELLQHHRRNQRFQLQSLGYLGKAVTYSSAEGLQELASRSTRPCAAGIGSAAATLESLEQLAEAFSAGHDAMKELMLAFWGSEVRPDGANCSRTGGVGTTDYGIWDVSV